MLRRLPYHPAIEIVLDRSDLGDRTPFAVHKRLRDDGAQRRCLREPVNLSGHHRLVRDELDRDADEHLLERSRRHRVEKPLDLVGRDLGRGRDGLHLPHGVRTEFAKAHFGRFGFFAEPETPVGIEDPFEPRHREQRRRLLRRNAKRFTITPDYPPHAFLVARRAVVAGEAQGGGLDGEAVGKGAGFLRVREPAEARFEAGHELRDELRRHRNVLGLRRHERVEGDAPRTRERIFGDHVLIGDKRVPNHDHAPVVPEAERKGKRALEAGEADGRVYEEFLRRRGHRGVDHGPRQSHVDGELRASAELPREIGVPDLKKWLACRAGALLPVRDNLGSDLLDRWHFDSRALRVVKDADRSVVRPPGEAVVAAVVLHQGEGEPLRPDVQRGRLARGFHLFPERAHGLSHFVRIEGLAPRLEGRKDLCERERSARAFRAHSGPRTSDVDPLAVMSSTPSSV